MEHKDKHRKAEKHEKHKKRSKRREEMTDDDTSEEDIKYKSAMEIKIKMEPNTSEDGKYKKKPDFDSESTLRERLKQKYLERELISEKWSKKEYTFANNIDKIKYDVMDERSERRHKKIKLEKDHRKRDHEFRCDNDSDHENKDERQFSENWQSKKDRENISNHSKRNSDYYRGQRNNDNKNREFDRGRKNNEERRRGRADYQERDDRAGHNNRNDRNNTREWDCNKGQNHNTTRDFMSSGTSSTSQSKTNKPEAKKEEPDFKLSGKLTEYTNTYNGVVIKYNEPIEARKPKTRWRLYPFKGDEALPLLQLHRQSAFLLGRDRKIADIPIDHPSCSKQHAVLQFRLVDYKRPDGNTGKRVKPYVIDLETTNGTFVNNKKIDARRYVELMEKDVIKFGFSSREYVLLHEKSKTDEIESEDEGENESDSDEKANKMKTKKK